MTKKVTAHEVTSHNLQQSHQKTEGALRCGWQWQRAHERKQETRKDCEFRVTSQLPLWLHIVADKVTQHVG